MGNSDKTCPQCGCYSSDSYYCSAMCYWQSQHAKAIKDLERKWDNLPIAEEISDEAIEDLKRQYKDMESRFKVLSTIVWLLLLAFIVWVINVMIIGGKV